jgi:hypothetical protein
LACLDSDSQMASGSTEPIESGSNPDPEHWIPIRTHLVSRSCRSQARFPNQKVGILNPTRSDGPQSEVIKSGFGSDFLEEKKHSTETVLCNVADQWHFGTDPDPRLWLMYPDAAISSMTFKTPTKNLFLKVFLLITYWRYIYIIFER